MTFQVDCSVEERYVLQRVLRAMQAGKVKPKHADWWLRAMDSPVACREVVFHLEGTRPYVAGRMGLKNV